MQFYLLFCLLALPRRLPVRSLPSRRPCRSPGLSSIRRARLCLPYGIRLPPGASPAGPQGMLPRGFALYAAALVALWLWSHDRFTLVCVATAAAI